MREGQLDSEILPRLYLNRINGLNPNTCEPMDWLIALEFGRIDDGQPTENWRGVNGLFGYLHDVPDGACVGFKVTDFGAFKGEAENVPEIWEGPRFIAPQLGLTNVPAGEIVLAAQPFFSDLESVNRFYFQEGCGADGEQALSYWQNCLECGDCMAHFALGYTLYELGRFREAYRHLRYYAEIAPAEAWNWCWFGKSAYAIDEIEEARGAYERAIALTECGGSETEAPELLDRLEAAHGTQ